ncbi:hypothetical protein T492DRAFT_831758 [Pavlovales sp. CCMP2436]|nr:hypothetical protein T492DRAFT_831758 [Pavlovales sp. CCMP2436]
MARTARLWLAGLLALARQPFSAAFAPVPGLRLLRRALLAGARGPWLAADAGAVPTPAWPSPAAPPSPAAVSLARIMPSKALPSVEAALRLPQLPLSSRLMVDTLALVTWGLARYTRSRGYGRALMFTSCLVACSINWFMRLLLRFLLRHASLKEPRDLATSDSRFATLSKVCVHYLERLPSSGADTPSSVSAAASAATGVDGLRGAAAGQADRAPRLIVHMNHGFGASCLSWLDVLSPLADGLNAVAIAHDRVGFGLTERPPANASAYAPGENQVIANQLLSTVGAEHGCAEAKHVLFGHSLGAQLSVLQCSVDLNTRSAHSS